MSAYKPGMNSTVEMETSWIVGVLTLSAAGP